MGSILKCRKQMRLQAIRGRGHGARPTKRAQLRHLKSRISARIDALERLQIHIDVQSEAMVARTAPDANADTRSLRSATYTPGAPR